jgi:hypothetical protein
MVRHGCGLFQRPAIFEMAGDAGGAERVVADLGDDLGAAARRWIIACSSVAPLL